jgi:hypothetical protein
VNGKKKKKNENKERDQDVARISKSAADDEKSLARSNLK